MEDYTPKSESTAGRTAQIANKDGCALGACLFITASELKQLGIRPEDTESISFVVDDESQVVEVESIAQSPLNRP